MAAALYSRAAGHGEVDRLASDTFPNPMCGRYTLSTPGAAVAELLELETTPELAPRYNIAPTQESAVVRLRPAVGGR